MRNTKVYLDDAFAYSGQNNRSQLGTSGKMEARVGQAGLAGDHVLPQKAISYAMARAGVAESSTAGKLVLGIQDSARNLRLMDSKLKSSKCDRVCVNAVGKQNAKKLHSKYSSQAIQECNGNQRSFE